MTSVNTLAGGSAAPLWGLYRSMSKNGANASQPDASDPSSPANTQPDNALNGEGPQFDTSMMVVLIQVQSDAGTAQGASGSSSEAPGAKLFASLDQDGDGSVTQAELEKAFTDNGGDASQADSIFKSVDTNGDGSISQDELSTAMKAHHHHRHGGGGHMAAQLFGDLDQDGDGSVSQSELAQGLSGVGGSDADAATLLQALDTDGNGSVSESELATALKSAFQSKAGHA